MARFSKFIGNLNFLQKNIVVMISAIISAMILSFIARQVNFFPSGAAGIGLSLQSLIKQNWVYPLFTAVLNVPFIMLGFFKIGKKFTFLSVNYTIVSTLLVTLFQTYLSDSISFFPPIVRTDVGWGLLAACVAGILYGFGLSLTYMAQGGAGGVDYVSMYYATNTRKSFAFYNFLVSTVTVLFISFMSGFLNTYLETGVWDFYNWFGQSLYLTIIFILFTSVIIDAMYPRFRTMVVRIVTSKGYEIRRFLASRKIPHKHTITDLRSGITNRAMNELTTVLYYFEYIDFINRVKQIDEDSFITAIQTSRIDGRLRVPKLK